MLLMNVTLLWNCMTLKEFLWSFVALYGHKRPMRAKWYLRWHIMVLNCRICLEWPCLASPHMVLLLLFTAIDNSTCVALCGLFMALFGLLWQNMSFLVVIDPNSFGLVVKLMTFLFFIRGRNSWNNGNCWSGWGRVHGNCCGWLLFKYCLCSNFSATKWAMTIWTVFHQKSAICWNCAAVKLLFLYP